MHAFVVIGAVWNRPPTQPPSSPEHVFNRHGFGPQTGQPHQGRTNWLTRTLLADGGPISVGGYRFGNDFWIDPGHPDAAAYTAEVLLHLVRRYDLDGLHLDRIGYPELVVGGQMPATGASVGYNPTSVGRFQRHHGLPEDGPPPDPGDPHLSRWRRDQGHRRRRPRPGQQSGDRHPTRPAPVHRPRCRPGQPPGRSRGSTSPSTATAPR